MGFSRQENWSGLPGPSPGIFPTQGLNPGLLHCKQILYHLSHQGSCGGYEPNYKLLVPDKKIKKKRACRKRSPSLLLCSQGQTLFSLECAPSWGRCGWGSWAVIKESLLTKQWGGWGLGVLADGAGCPHRGSLALVWSGCGLLQCPRLLTFLPAPRLLSEPGKLPTGLPKF